MKYFNFLLFSPMVGNFAVAVAASNDHKSSKNLEEKKSKSDGRSTILVLAGGRCGVTSPCKKSSEANSIKLTIAVSSLTTPL